LFNEFFGYAVECIKQREGRVVEMNDILFCLDRVNRVLETKNRRLGSEAGYDHYRSAPGGDA